MTARFSLHLQSKSMSLPEVGAAISVLLGFAPPSTLSSESSEKVIVLLTNADFLFLLLNSCLQCNIVPY